jgi:hypothetical protein
MSPKLHRRAGMGHTLSAGFVSQRKTTFERRLIGFHHVMWLKSSGCGKTWLWLFSL